MMRIAQQSPRFGYSPNIVSFSAPKASVQANHTSSQLPASTADNVRFGQALKAQRVRFGNNFATFKQLLNQLQLVSIAPGYEDSYLQAISSPAPKAVLPSIIEKTEDGGKIAIDPYSLMFANNIVYFSGPVTDHSAENLTVQLNYLMNKFEQEELSKSRTKSASKGSGSGDSEENKPTVRIVINSPGGSVLALYKILDTMNAMKKRGVVVQTVCEGLAASAASVMLVNGTKGHRYVTPNSQVMIHQPSYGAYGKHSDISISQKQGEKHYRRLVQVYADNIGKDPEQIYKDLKDDNWMDSQEALEYGLVDSIARN